MQGRDLRLKALILHGAVGQGLQGGGFAETAAITQHFSSSCCWAWGHVPAIWQVWEEGIEGLEESAQG